MINKDGILSKAMKERIHQDFNNLNDDFSELWGHIYFLREKSNQLQSNWNSLREWLETLKDSSLYSLSFKEPLRNVLDKMNELEGRNQK